MAHETVAGGGTLKLREGGLYERRDGVKLDMPVRRLKEDGNYRWVVDSEPDVEGPVTYTDEGRFSISMPNDDWDLVRVLNPIEPAPESDPIAEPKLQIREGAYYLRRDQSVTTNPAVRNTKARSKGDFPWRVDGNLYTDDGRYWLDRGEDPRDLISETTAPATVDKPVQTEPSKTIQVREGYWYRQRSTKEVGPATRNGSGVYCWAVGYHSYTDNGVFCSGKQSERDLVEELGPRLRANGWYEDSNGLTVGPTELRTLKEVDYYSIGGLIFDAYGRPQGHSSGRLVREVIDFHPVKWVHADGEWQFNGEPLGHCAYTVMDSNGHYLESNSEHGTGWCDRIRQTWTPSQLAKVHPALLKNCKVVPVIAQLPAANTCADSADDVAATNAPGGIPDCKHCGRKTMHMGDTCYRCSQSDPVSACHNWPEDYSQENGNYQSQCCNCKRLFTGHKRRVLCKLCDTSMQGAVEKSGVRFFRGRYPRKRRRSVWVMLGEQEGRYLSGFSDYIAHSGCSVSQLVARPDVEEISREQAIEEVDLWLEGVAEIKRLSPLGSAIVPPELSSSDIVSALELPATVRESLGPLDSQTIIASAGLTQVY